MDHESKQPIAGASVFLGNATIGNITTDDGGFILPQIKPGNYQLIVSCVGFEMYNQPIKVNNIHIDISTIQLLPKTNSLREIKIKSGQADPNWLRNYNWFKDEFLGKSWLAKSCNIVNPKSLDLRFNNDTQILTASTDEFLEIENRALGYRIKYLLTGFVRDFKEGTIHYDGVALFEYMKGTSVQQQRWYKRRQEVYANSAMHYLRAALSNSLQKEGFNTYQLANYLNPDRPDDGLIDTKIKVYTKLKQTDKRYKDSLAVWNKKANYPKILQQLLHWNLSPVDIVKATDQRRLYALGCDSDALYITYNKPLRFPKNTKEFYALNLNDFKDGATTIVNFNSGYAFFDDNGSVINPDGITYNGAWANNRIATLLPVNFEP